MAIVYFREKFQLKSHLVNINPNAQRDRSSKFVLFMLFVFIVN